MDMEYEIRESARAKRVSISVHPDGRVVALKPKRVSYAVVEAFIRTKAAWIEDARRVVLRRSGGVPPTTLPRPRKGSVAYKEAVARARTLATERLKYFNTMYGYSYGAISIRNQKTRWGSCSAENNLSFNYKIAFLPPELADYIIVHELCHTREHNHSARFWALVARTIPNHVALRKTIRTRYVL